MLTAYSLVNLHATYSNVPGLEARDERRHDQH